MAIRAYWFRWLENYGDKLTPWIVHKLTGELPEFAPASDRCLKLVSVGSILNHVRQHCVVWGTGMMSRADIADSRADYRAVRGPLTARQISSQGGRAPEVFGDPGLLLPRWIVRSPVMYRVGIVPHYVHYEEALRRWSGGDALVVDVRGEVEEVVKQITSCECIVSSSLHGLVTACAYGLPHARLKFSKPIGGDGSKFRDFYQGIGARLPPVIDCVCRTPIPEQLAEKVAEAPVCNVDDLWEACPIEQLASG